MAGLRRARVGLAAAALALLCSAAEAQTSGTTPDGLEYSVSGGAVTITGYTGNSVAVVVPSTIAGSPVTAIGSVAFYGASIPVITLPASLVSIGSNAFQGCTGLKTIFIPAGVTSLGSFPFYGCNSLSSITVDPANPAYSSDGTCLFDKAQANLIEAPPGLAGQYTLPSSAITIAGGSFENCTGVTSVTVPIGLETIGNSSFSGCTSLASFSMPATVTTLGYAAFSGCTSLLSFSIDPSNPDFTSDGQAIMDKAGDTLIDYVSGSSGSYSIPGTVTTIGQAAFDGSRLSSVSIPDSVTTIDYDAFGNCGGLTTLSIPASVTNISFLAFGGSNSLAAITVDPSNPNYSSIGGVLFNKAGTILVEYAPGKTGGYTVPAGVTEIGLNAFGECGALTSVTLPAGLINLDQGAFAETKLSSVTIPASTLYIGPEAFEFCSALTRVYFQGNAPDIDPRAFDEDSLSLKLIYEPGASGWTGSVAGLTPVSSASLPRLTNISTRALVGTGGNILIPGFVIAGIGQETLLIRADGPALTQFSVSGYLASPTLSVVDSSGAVIASNTGWSTASNASSLASTAASVGAFALQPNSADCAVLVTLPAGDYTVQVSGVGGTTGVALAEIYEVATTGTRLVNISTRAQVGTGANLIIAGFVISGSGEEDLLLRGDGPGLTQFSVPGVLAEPSLNLFDRTGTSIASTTGWGQGAAASQIAAIAAEVGAFAFAPGSQDSAMTTSLVPGNYTVQVSGVGGTTGVALAEVYEAP